MIDWSSLRQFILHLGPHRGGRTHLPFYYGYGVRDVAISMVPFSINIKYIVNVYLL